MKIRMYECGFGDCFRLREPGERELFVDFGIHRNSWRKPDKITRFDGIIADMDEDDDFLLTHFHDDHYNGVIYMAANTEHRFGNVYLPDVWKIDGSVNIISLLLLRGIFTRSVIRRGVSLIDFLREICRCESKVHFISRGRKFHNDRYIALWPDPDTAAERAEKLLARLRRDLGEENVRRIEDVARQLDHLVVTMEEAGQNGAADQAELMLTQFNRLLAEYEAVQDEISMRHGPDYYGRVQYDLTKFGNEISIVFQNLGGDRNVLFTGDFGKYWDFIETNADGRVAMLPYYEVVKVPHHGTDSYYHSFSGKVNVKSTLLIPNGYIHQAWPVAARYKADSVQTVCGTVCAHDSNCAGHGCAKCGRIFPKLFMDV